MAKPAIDGHSANEPYLRHATHYLGVALRANELCEQGNDVQDGVSVYTREWRNVLCAWEWAAKRINEEEEARNVCISYLRNTINLLLVAKRPHKMVPLCTAALNAAIILKDRVNESLALSLIGHAHYLLNQYAEAEVAHRRCLALCEEIHDPFNVDIASSLANVAMHYVTKGQYGAAEPLLERCHAIFERTLGNTNWKTGQSLYGLAQLRMKQDLYVEAEPLFVRALSIIEDTMGAEHPRTAAVVGDLASCYMHQGRHTLAEPLLRRSLSIVENTLGLEHDDAAEILTRMAEVSALEGRHPEAEQLYIRAIAICENAGDETQKLAGALEETGVFYYNCYRYKEASLLYQRSLSIVERLFGLEHPVSLELVFNLAMLKMEQHEHLEADVLFRRAIVGFEKALGANDPHTQTVKQGYAVFQKRSGGIRGLLARITNYIRQGAQSSEPRSKT